MEGQSVETRLVCGFLDAGKTTYIQDCILHDYFHKYGETLILSTEDGEIIVVAPGGTASLL